MTEIFDRGNKKWVSLMIPELREGLKEIFTDPPPERPELDEQRMEEINLLLTQAYRAGRQVTIRYWDDGERDIVGRIVRLRRTRKKRLEISKRIRCYSTN